MKRKIILVTLGSKGDFLPFVGLAKSLALRGFEPIVLSCESYRAICEREGIRFDSFMSTEEFASLDSPVLWKPLRGLNYFLKRVMVGAAQPAYNAIARHADHGAVAIITNHTMPVAYVAAEKFCLPIVSVFLQPYSHISAADPARISPAVDRIVRSLSTTGRRWLAQISARLMQARISPLNRMRVELGLKPWRNFFTETRYSADLVLGLWPDWFCPKKSDWPAVCQSAGFVDCSFGEKMQMSDEVHEFLEHAPLVFAMGSEMMQNFEANVKIFRETCRSLGKKGVFVTPIIRGEGMRIFDDDFICLEAASFSELFPKASCVITHGGIGTVAIALASGRPIVSVPMAYDQFDNAYQVERLGAGVQLARESLTSTGLVDAISEAFRFRSPLLAQRTRQRRGADTAAQLIVRYLQSSCAQFAQEART